MKWFKYRITTDNYKGYELQYKFILCPYWTSDSKSFASSEEVEMYYHRVYNKRIIKYLI